MIRKLNPEQLYNRCDAGSFVFQTTSEIEDFGGTISQEKALRALDFGLAMNSSGFNIFVLGETGTGKMSTVMALRSIKVVASAIFF
jgi:DNA replication protein DnaC